MSADGDTTSMSPCHAPAGPIIYDPCLTASSNYYFLDPFPPDAAASDPEVTWQVAFCALVPLALGCMTQPVGRVFDASPELRVWMRANPLICVGDIFQYLLRIMIAYTVEPCWSWRHFQGALADRFRDTDWSAPRPQFEQAALGRWALVLLGGILGPTVKLMAMRGIPVTQSLAMMYTVALVFGEVLNVAAEVTLRHPAARPPSQPQLSWKTPTLLSACVCFLLDVLQGLPLCWLKIALHGTIAEASDIPGRGISESEGGIITWLAVIIVFRMLLIVLALPPPDPNLGNVSFMPISTLYHLSLLWFTFAPVSLVRFVPRARVIDSLSISMVLACMLLFLLLSWLGWKALRRLGRSRLGQILGVPRGSLELLWVVSFLNLLLLSGLSYAFVFDGTGTVNPPWLAVFG